MTLFGSVIVAEQDKAADKLKKAAAELGEGSADARQEIAMPDKGTARIQEAVAAFQRVFAAGLTAEQPPPNE